MKYIILIAILLLCSCQQDLEIEVLDFEEALVVTSFIRPDTTMTVFLTNNVSVLSKGQPEAVTESIITLYEDDLLIGQFSETVFEPDELNDYSNPFKGVYQLGYYPKAGKSYRIEIESEEYPNVRATTSIPVQNSDFEVTLSEPRNISSKYDRGYSFVDVEYDAYITINDAVENNYYALAVTVQKGKEIYEFDNEGNITNCNVERQNYEIDFQSNAIVFEGTKSTGFEEDGGKVFNDDLFRNQNFEVQITFKVWGYRRESCESEEVYFDKFYVQVRSVSKEYYEYIRTTTLQKFVLEDPFAEPVQIFNNIEGGLGVFGGFNIETFEFSLRELIPSE